MLLRRTPVTWALYGVNGAWASFVYLSGPVSSVLTDDLGMPVATAGLMGTALAGGISTAAATAPRAVRRLGRDGATRAGLIVLSGALVGIGLAPQAASGVLAFGLVLALVWIGATGGGTVVNSATARLSEAHREHSGRVITEANAAAAWVGLLSPLLLGAALGAGYGWQVGILVCLLAALAALAGLALANKMESRRAGVSSGSLVGADGRDAHLGVEPALEPVFEPAQPEGEAPKRLPRIFWPAMVALFAAAATEFAINFWGSTLIQDRTATTASAATAAMSAIVAGIAIGRTLGSWLTARLGAHRMLLGGFGLALLGFAVLWLSSTLAMAIGGLLVAGLGLATLFPLILDRGITLSAGNPDLAMSRASLVLGIAVASAPFALGALGAVVPVRTALLLVPAVVVAGIIGVLRSRPPAASAMPPPE